MLIQFLLGINVGCFLCMYTVSPTLVGLTTVSLIFEYGLPSPYSYLFITYAFVMVGLYSLIRDLLEATGLRLSRTLPKYTEEEEEEEETVEPEEEAAAATEEETVEPDEEMVEPDEETVEPDEKLKEILEDILNDTFEHMMPEKTISDTINLLPPSPTDTEAEDEYADMPGLIQADGTLLAEEEITDVPSLETYEPIYQ